MTQSRRFHEKVAVVTAATAGIGLGIAHRLGKEGAKLVICSRKQNNVDETIEQLRAKNIEVVGTAANVSKIADVKRLVELAVSSYGRVDIVVSNAAVNPFAGAILNTPDWAIDKLFEVNVKSAIQLLREIRPHMPQGSSIVLVTSNAGYTPEPPISLYGVTKTALVGLGKALAHELGSDGIRVNCIAPGYCFATDTSKGSQGWIEDLNQLAHGQDTGAGVVPTKFAAALVESPEMVEMQKARTFLGRLGTAEDMAAAVAFLASEDASYITGETLVIAGGGYSRL